MVFQTAHLCQCLVTQNIPKSQYSVCQWLINYLLSHIFPFLASVQILVPSGTCHTLLGFFFCLKMSRLCIWICTQCTLYSISTYLLCIDVSICIQTTRQMEREIFIALISPHPHQPLLLFVHDRYVLIVLIHISQMTSPEKKYFLSPLPHF